MVRRRSGFFAVIISCITLIGAPLVAAFEFPKPTGRYGVGTRSYNWVDVERADPFLPHRPPQPRLFRELLVQVWYPTTAKAAKASSPYLPHMMPYLRKRAFDNYHVPAKVFDYMVGDMFTYAVKNAPIAEGENRLPVVVFSHGLGSMCELNTSHLENLASHGYVVFGINHTHMCFMTLFLDGHSYPFMFDWKKPNKMIECNRIVLEWQGDVAFVLDCIAHLAVMSKSPFVQRLDLERMGMFGHSMGGATATQMCRRDPRIKAAINMDGPLLGVDHAQGFSKPYMVFMAEESLKRAESIMPEELLKMRNMTRAEEALLGNIYKAGIKSLCQNVACKGGDAYTVLFKGAGHNVFTDLPMGQKNAPRFFSLLDYIASFYQGSGLDIGIVEPDKIVASINRYIVEFFDKYLCGLSSPIFEQGASTDSTVVLSRYAK